jgi:hypothetical protein
MKIVVISPKDKMDYLAETIIEGLYANDVEIYASDAGNGIKPNDVYSDFDILKHSKTCDFIFVIWGKVIGGYTGPKYYLHDMINLPHKTIYIDGSEWTQTGHPKHNQVKLAKADQTLRRGMPWINEKMLTSCNWYFKRECYPADVELGIIPLLFGTLDRNFYNETTDKEYDVFCAFGQLNDGLRSEITEVCRKIKSDGYNVIVDSGMEYDEYKMKLSKSYISIDSWGGGDCCARLWEIFANKSCAFSQRYNIEFPDKFIDGVSFVEFDTINNFEDKLRYYLYNREKTLAIAEAGYDHMMKYHTAKYRVEYIFNMIGCPL